jgi:curved DNA-binding protein CbpA
MAKRDYYVVLGVSRGASEQDVKTAFRRLAKDCHPDVNPQNKTVAEARFKELNEAYEVIKDPQQRKLYDQFGHAAFEPGFRPPPGSGTTTSPTGDFQEGGDDVGRRRSHRAGAQQGEPPYEFRIFTDHDNFQPDDISRAFAYYAARRVVAELVQLFNVRPDLVMRSAYTVFEELSYREIGGNLIRHMFGLAIQKKAAIPSEALDDILDPYVMQQASYLKPTILTAKHIYDLLDAYENNFPAIARAVHVMVDGNDHLLQEVAPRLLYMSQGYQNMFVGHLLTHIRERAQAGKVTLKPEDFDDVIGDVRRRFQGVVSMGPEPRTRSDLKWWQQLIARALRATGKNR